MVFQRISTFLVDRLKGIEGNNSSNSDSPPNSTIYNKETSNSNINQQIKEKLTEYKFWDFLKVEKKLNNSQIVQLEQLIFKNDTPYIIALLHELGYLEFFKNKYCKTSKERDRTLSAIFNVNERRIKGNINVLNKNSKESKETYTSYQHVDEIKDLLKGLSEGL